MSENHNWFFMDKERLVYIEKIYAIWGGILFIWALYRAFLSLPEWVDELVVKPLVFLGPPVFFILVKEKRPLASIGVNISHLPRDLFFGLFFGILFTVVGVFTNFIKHGSINLNPIVAITGNSLIITLLLSLVSAFTEETLVRGFLFSRLAGGYKSDLKGMLISSLMYLFILVPIVLVRLHLRPYALLLLLVSNFVLSFANTMIFSETKSVTVPVLIHAFWNMAVVLYL